MVDRMLERVGMNVSCSKKVGDVEGRGIVVWWLLSQFMALSSTEVLYFIRTAV